MSEYLVHYGVKGMKWGKRKATVKTGVLGDMASDLKEDISNTLDKVGDPNIKSGYKYSSYDDMKKYLEVNARAAAGKATAAAYKERGKAAVKKAFERLTSGDFKGAVDAGKRAVDSLFKYFEAKMSTPRLSAIQKGDLRIGTKKKSHYRTVRYTDGTEIKYEKHDK